MTVSPIAHVLAGDFVLVVQGGALHHDAADGDRLERRDRRQGALPPDRDQDVVEHRLRLLGREFMRERPARRAADHAEPLLQGEIVDLVDDAVDVIGQRRAIGGDVAVIGQHLRRRRGTAASDR